MTPDPIPDALALRAAALALLAGRQPDARGADALADASEAAWRLFLRAECCASALGAALRRQGWAERLAPGARAALARAESRELQRVLAARAQLRTLDALAAERGLAPVVLKGGAAVGAGAIADLGDLDLADDAAGCRALDAALRARGYGPAAPAGNDGAWSHVFGPQLPPLAGPDGLPVELHVRADGAAADDRRSPLIPGCRALRREVGAAPLFELVRHAVVQHPHRRGHLRDLVVIAELAARCTAEEVARARARCQADRYAPELVAMLEQALALAAGTPIPEPEATRRIVARKYALALGREAWLSRAIPRWGPRLAFVAVDRRALRRHELGALLRDASRRHGGYALPALARRAPRLAAVVAALAARAYRLAVAGVVIGAGPLVRRRVARVLGVDRRTSVRPVASRP